MDIWINSQSAEKFRWEQPITAQTVPNTAASALNGPKQLAVLQEAQ